MKLNIHIPYVYILQILELHKKLTYLLLSFYRFYKKNAFSLTGSLKISTIILYMYVDSLMIDSRIYT